MAYVGLADSYAVQPDPAYRLIPGTETLWKAETAAKTALRIDPNLGEAYATLGEIDRLRWRWADSEREFKQAIYLSPNYATVHHWYAGCLRDLGRFDAATAELRRALELDPLSIVINERLGYSFYRARQFEPAIQQLKRTLEMDSGSALAHADLGAIYLQESMFNEAISEFRKGVDLSGRGPAYVAQLGYGLGITRQTGEAQKLIGELTSARRYVSAYEFALIYIGLGDKDHALEWLQKAFSEHETGLVLLNTDLVWDPLRSDPAFQNLLRRIGFPQ